MLLLSAISVLPANALTIRSVSNGDWNSIYTWSPQQVPQTPDTIMIAHYVTFGQTITIHSPTVLMVTATGTVCGQYALNVECGSTWYNYGLMKILSSTMNTTARNYGELDIQNFMSLAGCGDFRNQGTGTMTVGVTYTCGLPSGEGGSASSVEDYSMEGLHVFPNPVAAGDLNIQAPEGTTIQLCDIMGTVLRRTMIIAGQAQIAMNDLPTGAYLLRLEHQRKMYCQIILRSP